MDVRRGDVRRGGFEEVDVRRGGCEEVDVRKMM